MPPFYKHNRNDETSEGHDPIAEPAMRVDISALRKYISTVPGIYAAEGICKRSFDVLFFGGKAYCKQSRVASISNFTGFTEFVPPGREKMLKGRKIKAEIDTVFGGIFLLHQFFYTKFFALFTLNVLLFLHHFFYTKKFAFFTPQIFFFKPIFLH